MISSLNIYTSLRQWVCRACLLLASLPALSSPVYLVESVPLDTHYGQADIVQTQATWLHLITNAKHTIDIGAFYFNSVPHSSMAKVITALNLAAKHHIRVRVLLDKQFRRQSAASVKLLKPPVSFHYLDMKKVTGGVMHAKYMLIDQHISFVGSQNFDWKAINQNHEMGIVVDNAPLARTIGKVFAWDWQTAQGKKTAPNKSMASVTRKHPIHVGKLTLYPAFSPPKALPNGVDWELPRLLSLLDQAKKTIKISLYQYSSLSGYKLRHHWRLLDKALERAATRGVQVQMIVSNVMQGKRPLVALKQLAKHKNIRVKMSHVPPYKGRRIKYGRVEHAKFMVIDGHTSWIGTGNWSRGYFYQSRDMAIVVLGQSIAGQLQRVFDDDWGGSYTKGV